MTEFTSEFFLVYSFDKNPKTDVCVHPIIQLMKVMFLFLFLVPGLSSIAQTDLLKKANDHLQQQQYTEAIGAFKEADKISSLDGGSLFRLGVCYHLAGDYQQALIAFSRSQKINSTPGPSYFWQARSFARLGETEKAFSSLTAAVKSGFSNYTALMNNPDMTDLRNDARFNEMAGKVLAITQPCEVYPEYSQLDFWIGEWQQRDNSNLLLGTTTVKKLLHGCVLEETSINSPDYEARAFHHYNPVLKKWQQSYVDTRAGFSQWYGELENNVMHYNGEMVSGDKLIKGRNTMTRIDDNKIKWVFETSVDNGATWQKIFDGFYVRIN
jgi:tetratricopeptide (TPR) repeat protein